MKSDKRIAMKNIIYSLLLTICIGMKADAQTPAFYFHVYSADSNYSIALNQYSNSIDTVEAYIVMDSSTSILNDTIKYFWAVNDIDFIVTDSMVTSVSTTDSVFTMLDPNILSVPSGGQVLQRQSVLFTTSRFALGHDLVIVWPRIRDVVSANPIIFEIEMRLDAAIEEVPRDQPKIFFDGLNYVWKHPTQQIKSLTILDMQGKLLLQDENNHIAVNSIATGVYIYKLLLEDGKYVQGKVYLMR